MRQDVGSVLQVIGCACAIIGAVMIGLAGALAVGGVLVVLVGYAIEQGE
jgi:hypothetical protein